MKVTGVDVSVKQNKNAVTVEQAATLLEKAGFNAASLRSERP